MSYCKRLITFCFLFFICISCTKENKSLKKPNPLILISFDGFRHDYFSKIKTPHFDQFAIEGVKAQGLIPVFPTKTFPNHYSIATGLYPENSGLIGNTIYDPEFGEWYRISDREAVQDEKWYAGEPIWNTVEKQGLKAGTMFWIGSEAPIQNMRPTYWKPYNGSMKAKARIDTVLKWMSYEDERRVDFATLYFEDVDHAGHVFGLESDSLNTAIARADSLLGYLEAQMKQTDQWDSTNIIIVSDHGMTSLAEEKIIPVESMVDTTRVKRITTGPVSMLQPKAGQTQAVYNQLKKNERYYKVYKKAELPDRYHLKNNSRIPAIVVVADLGYMIMKEKYRQSFIENLPSGMHGFDNNEMQMQGILLARGPAFKNGFKMGSIQNVHLYELMAHLLNVNPASNNGSLDSVRVMLKQP